MGLRQLQMALLVSDEYVLWIKAGHLSSGVSAAV